MPKVILPAERFRSVGLLTISEARWHRLLSHIPGDHSPEMDARLRDGVLDCCAWLLTEQRRLSEGEATAAALRSPGTRQRSQFQRLADGLRTAADAWREMGDVHNDRLSDWSRFEALESMAKDIERRLEGLQAIPAQSIDGPWRAFVRKVADAFEREGLAPTATGRVYEDDARLTWFQEFMAALQHEVLGINGRPSNSAEAFATEIAKALAR